MKGKSIRLDNFIVENNLCDSRNKAKSLIKAGIVSVDGKIVLKPALMISDSADVKILSQHTYVARSAYKLINALDCFGIDLKGMVAADIGASTGGFSQVLLERGAKKVYAVDVGTGQLNEKLLSDNRIVNMEKVNARNLNSAMFDSVIDLVTVDLSFISLSYVLKPAYDILNSKGSLICLVKPQFELGPCYLSKNGVVKDIKLHYEAVLKIAKFAVQLGFSLCSGCYSGVAGESGNREYFLYLIKDSNVPSMGFDKLKEYLK